ncbi:MAG: lipopolysaccharide biosynthesis protein, partial [Oscillospiraceae bacterium]|nr:lipopolysaccharide biosynthesis protein [Oscillospiraceae bacterium]
MEDRSKNIQGKIATSLVWKFLEQFGQQFMAIIVSMVLARLLNSNDYRPVTLINAIIAVASVFVTSGFSTALIQKSEVDDEDYSSAFYLCFGVAALAYIALFFAAPFVADFYGIPSLTAMLRVMTLTLFLGAVNSVQSAVISRNMQFKKYFYSSLAGIIASGTVGITMAYNGFGTWSLVASNLTSTAVITLVLWFTVKWRPKLVFNVAKAKALFNYGYKLLLSGLLDSLFNNIYPMIIDKMQSLNPAMASQNDSMSAYYAKGKDQPNLIINNINNAIQGVMFPAFSAVQQDRAELKKMAKRTITTSCFVIFPISIGLAAVARPLILLMYTDTWAGAIPF